MTVTESLKRFRKENKIIQKDIADLLGMKTQMYQYYESKGGLSIVNLKKIANHYNVSADYLLGLTDDPRPVNQILAEMEKSKSGGEYVTRAEFEELKASIAQLKQSTEI